MSLAPQTPQRALPGAYVQTPALSRFKSAHPGQPIQRSNSANSLSKLRSFGQGLSAKVTESSESAPPPKAADEGERQSLETLKPIERAAKTINETLAQDARYPELDSYIGRKPVAESYVNDLADRA